MATDLSKVRVEDAVRFLNVDVDLVGTFDREALLRGFGDRIFVLRNEENEHGESVVSFELSTARPAFPDLVSEIVELVRALPDDARSAWGCAARRVFDVGIQAGLEPHSTEWTLGIPQMAALVSVGAELTITVCGAVSAVS